MGPIPPARHADVFRGSRPPWRRANPDAVRIASNHFGLSVSPTHRFVRHDRHWWLPVRGGERRLLLWRQENGHPRWSVLAKSPKGRIRDLSFEQPVAINPMGQGLRFVFRGEEWDNVWQMAEGFRILYYRQDERLYDGEIESWMAVARDEKGWKRLLPCGKPVPQRPLRSPLKTRIWTEVDNFPCRYRHFQTGDYPGQVHVVRFEGGDHINFVLPDPDDPSYFRRTTWRRPPTLKRLADLFSYIPHRLLASSVSKVVVHTRSYHYKDSARYHPSLKRIDLYPPSFGDLMRTVYHEVLGHCLWPYREDFEALWVSAMLADGRAFSRSVLNDSDGEDFARSVELYLSECQPARFSHRFAVLGLFLRPDGRRITQRATEEASKLFRVDGDRLVMRGC